MRIYLKAFVLNLAKNNKEVSMSGLVPKHLRDIEREMEKGNLTAEEVMKKLKGDKFLRPVINDSDWSMIEREVKKMVK